MPEQTRTRRRTPAPTTTPSEDAARHLNPLDMTLMEKHRQCPATSKRTGRRCKNLCSLGMRSCRIHGSGTLRAKIAAAERIRAAAGYAAALLVELMADPAVDVKLRADIARDILTRAGIEEAKHLEVSAQVEAPWQRLIREGSVFQVVYDEGEENPRAAAPAQPKRPELEMTAAVVPPSDSQAARATYLAARTAGDPMPPVRDVQRVDGPRPRERRRRT